MFFPEQVHFAAKVWSDSVFNQILEFWFSWVSGFPLRVERLRPTLQLSGLIVCLSHTPKVYSNISPGSQLHRILLFTPSGNQCPIFRLSPVCRCKYNPDWFVTQKLDSSLELQGVTV